MAKNFTVTKTIGGKEYTAQFNGISAALEAVDSSRVDGTEVTSIVKTAKYILKNVIVKPANMDIDDFDSIEEFNEVIAFGGEVMRGNFRELANEGATKEKSA